jgi:hypothetical protein
MISVIVFSNRMFLDFVFGAVINNLIPKTIAAYSDLLDIFGELWMLRNVEQDSQTDRMQDDQKVGKETRPKYRHGAFVERTADVSNVEGFFVVQMGIDATDELGR